MLYSVHNIIDDISEIALLQFMGGDLATVNAARQSYSAESAAVSEKEVRLITYLGAHQHHAPFRHTMITLQVKAPEFVARQWYKHVVGSSYSFVDTPWSEFSQRYRSVAPDYYLPAQIREPHPTNKQQSVSIRGCFDLRESINTSIQNSIQQYEALLCAGVARELARIVLPTAMYTEFTWTASLQAMAHFVALRDEAGAQFEIKRYAQEVGDICRRIAPHSFDALMKNHPINNVQSVT